MQKEIKASYGGINAKVGNQLVNRLIPNKHVQAVGPFVFLDHLYPVVQKPAIPEQAKGKFAHPNKGISTVTYVLSGEVEHFDSCGNHGIIGAGGIQWMKAGSGIQQDGDTTASFQYHGGLLHLLRFWINLPAKNKNDEPEYANVQPGDIPELAIPGNVGKLRILIGSYGVKSSLIKTLSPQFLYHISLHPKSAFTLHTKATFEYAAFVPTDEVKINDAVFSRSELIIFQQDDGDITLSNPGVSHANIMLFGGEPYTEAIVAEGPFVMNTRAEICEAYKDFHLGKYGKISYPIKS